MEFRIVENPEADQAWAQQIERLTGFPWPWTDTQLRSILINRTDNEFSHAEVVEILGGDSTDDSTLLGCHASQGHPTFSTRLVEGLQRFNAKYGIHGFSIGSATKPQTEPSKEQQAVAPEQSDLIEADEIAKLVGVQKKTVQSVVSKWRGAGHQISYPCSYKAIRPLMLEQWPRRSAVLSEDFAKVRSYLDQHN